MRLSAYLSQSRHGVFYFRWPIPHHLHPEQKRSDMRISLHMFSTIFADYPISSRPTLLSRGRNSPHDALIFNALSDLRTAGQHEVTQPLMHGRGIGARGPDQREIEAAPHGTADFNQVASNDLRQPSGHRRHK